jgi:hypothetical protein
VSCQLHASAALPAGKVHCSHWLGGWVNRSVCVDTVEKKNFFASVSNRTPSLRSYSPYPSHYIDYPGCRAVLAAGSVHTCFCKPVKPFILHTNWLHFVALNVEVSKLRTNTTEDSQPTSGNCVYLYCIIQALGSIGRPQQTVDTHATHCFIVRKN